MSAYPPLDANDAGFNLWMTEHRGEWNALKLWVHDIIHISMDERSDIVNMTFDPDRRQLVMDVYDYERYDLDPHANAGHVPTMTRKYETVDFPPAWPTTADML